ncbi:MAG TPA: hypothetical protein VHF24_07895 [Acidimicrobiales bacterium]|nr:hypothetical protein [Acidimicrobiales bacterium]
MTSGNDLRDERGARGPLGTLPGVDPAPTFANGSGPDAEDAPGDSPHASDTAPLALDDRGLLPEATGAEQLVDEVRTAVEGLQQGLAPGSTDAVGWTGLLARVRAAARTQRSIAESERKVLELRERAAAEVDAVYEAAAGRTEELLAGARSLAAKLIEDARTETARVRREAEVGADLVRREAESTAVAIIGEAEREAASKLAGADHTLREQIAQAEREAALVLERSHEQATTWLAEAKQACVEMLGRAREEADRMLDAAREERTDVPAKVRRETEDTEWRAAGQPPLAGDLTGRTEAATSRQHRRGITPGEPVIGSRGSTTAFSGGGDPQDRGDDTADRHRGDRRDMYSRPDGRRRRFRS